MSFILIFAFELFVAFLGTWGLSTLFPELIPFSLNSFIGLLLIRNFLTSKITIK